MAGSIVRLATNEVVCTPHDGDAAGLAAAKAALATGGLLQMGPGTEGLALGAGWGIIALARIDALGRMFLSRFNMTDGDDPTKVLSWLCNGISPATTRTVTVPNWSGILLLPATPGNNGEFLQSIGGGGAPVWAPVSITNTLLDGANHTDTIAKAAARGALIVGVAGPSWDRLTIGAANTVLTSDGTDVAWSLNPAVQHDTLAHLKPFSVANCGWVNATDTITTSGGGFANVKIGDFVYPGSGYASGVQGAVVDGLTDSNTISVNRTNGTGGDLSGVTMIITPGDHWNDTVALTTGTGAGYLMSTGRGTYNETNTSGTFQEWTGPVRWGPILAGTPTDFRVAGDEGGTPSGFCTYNKSTGHLCYWNVAALTGNVTMSVPATGGSIITNTSTDNSITGSKHFTGATILDSDGTTNKTVFQSGGGSNFLAFAATGTTLRVATWPDIAGNVVLRNAQGNHTGQTAALGSQTLATAPPVGMYRVTVYMRTSATGTGAADFRLNWNDGTARTNEVLATLDLTATTYAQATFAIYVASGNVTYDITFGAAATYDARVRMEAI